MDRHIEYNTKNYAKYFNVSDEIDEWIMLNALRILRSDTRKSCADAVSVSISQLEMDVNTNWYDELRFSLDDLRNKSFKELNKQQNKFVIKYITPHYI